MTSTRFQVNGLTTEGQALRFTEALLAVPGTTSVRVDLETGTVTVSGTARLADRATGVARAAGLEVASRFPAAPVRRGRRWHRVGWLGAPALQG